MGVVCVLRRWADAVLAVPRAFVCELFSVGFPAFRRGLLFQRRGDGIDRRLPATGESVAGDRAAGHCRVLFSRAILALTESRRGQSGTISGVRTRGHREASGSQTGISGTHSL